jgi:hypothetical protein
VGAAEEKIANIEPFERSFKKTKKEIKERHGRAERDRSFPQRCKHT